MDLGELRQAYKDVRAQTDALHRNLSDEDCTVQSMPDASPTRWHLGHTTWFFETFPLGETKKDSPPYHPQFRKIFNSYYNAIGEQYPRPQRGLLTRPSRAEILQYRSAVDEAIHALLDELALSPDRRAMELIRLGLHHEQQHQELILTDIKHAFSHNPLHPAVFSASPGASNGSDVEPCALEWRSFDAGLREIGHAGAGFAFDNEMPRHRIYLEPFELASRLVTNGEFLEFIRDAGYQRPEFWLSDGWSALQSLGWRAPLYWLEPETGDAWQQFSLFGLAPLRAHDPVCHISYYEADAYARWRGARLPREEEWELAAEPERVRGNFVESCAYRPLPASGQENLDQLFGDVWEWTMSPYSPYPGFAPGAGAIGEYNGKFMCDQFVLRGGSCATPAAHMRSSYRNFFPAGSRWQFSGLRLARTPGGNR